LQPLYEIVNSEPFKAALVSEAQLVNIVLNLVVLVPAPEINNGTVIRLVQPLNMLPMFVTSGVLNKGTVIRDGQFRNIRNMVVTIDVLKNGTVVRDEQF